jgi:hypothetical protein
MYMYVYLIEKEKEDHIRNIENMKKKNVKQQM